MDLGKAPFRNQRLDQRLVPSKTEQGVDTRGLAIFWAFKNFIGNLGELGRLLKYVLLI